MKSKLLNLLAGLALLACFLAVGFINAGCSTGIKVPPGSLDYWHHTDNYAAFKDDVLLENVIKLDDGTFVIGHYVGSAGAMGQGPTDEIRNLHINADGKPVPPSPAATAALQKLRAAQSVTP